MTGQIVALKEELSTANVLKHDLLMSQGKLPVAPLSAFDTTKTMNDRESEQLKDVFAAQLAAIDGLGVRIRREDAAQVQAEALRHQITALRSAYRGRVARLESEVALVRCVGGR